MSGERQGMSTTAKVLLIVGGAIGTLVVAMIVVGVFAFRNLVENAPELLEEFGEQIQSVAVASLGNVSADFTTVVSEAGTVMLLGELMVLEPAAEGSDFTFSLESAEGDPVHFDLRQVTEYLDRVARGEAYFADIGREDAGDGADAAGSEVPEWVTVYPDARHSAGALHEFDEFTFGIEVVLADASAEEVLDWYGEEASDFGFATQWTSSISSNRDGDDRPRHGTISMSSPDRRMMVLVAEDDRRDSFVVLLYKG